jgi:hypothetical protein
MIGKGLGTSEEAIFDLDFTPSCTGAMTRPARQ